MSSKRLALLPIVVVSSAVALSACSSSAEVKIGGDPTVPEKQVEQNAQKELTAKVGQQAPPIDCPGDLTAKVGEVMTCTTMLGGKPYAVTLTVNTVKGTDVQYDVKVADKPSQ